MNTELMERSGEREEAVQKATGRELSRPLRVCFVCTGNTCRSPMAAAVANHLAKLELDAYPEPARAAMTPRVEAISAGLAAHEGDPIAANARLALERAGIQPVPAQDYRDHTAHNLPPEIADQCDRIIGMTGEHVMGLLMRFPMYAGKIEGMPEPIPDPYGGDEETYRAALEAITRGVRKLLFEEE